jgi:hypothetical protein
MKNNHFCFGVVFLLVGSSLVSCSSGTSRSDAIEILGKMDDWTKSTEHGFTMPQAYSSSSIVKEGNNEVSTAISFSLTNHYFYSCVSSCYSSDHSATETYKKTWYFVDAGMFIEAHLNKDSTGLHKSYDDSTLDTGYELWGSMVEDQKTFLSESIPSFTSNFIALLKSFKGSGDSYTYNPVDNKDADGNVTEVMPAGLVANVPNFAYEEKTGNYVFTFANFLISEVEYVGTNSSNSIKYTWANQESNDPYDDPNWKGASEE